MAALPYSWQKFCVKPLRETDSRRALRLLEVAICAIEQRYAEWHTSPGTPEEVAAIREAISKLRARLWRLQADQSKGAA